MHNLVVLSGLFIREFKKEGKKNPLFTFALIKQKHLLHVQQMAAADDDKTALPRFSYLSYAGGDKLMKKDLLTEASKMEKKLFPKFMSMCDDLEKVVCFVIYFVLTLILGSS